MCTPEWGLAFANVQSNSRDDEPEDGMGCPSGWVDAGSFHVGDPAAGCGQQLGGSGASNGDVDVGWLVLCVRAVDIDRVTLVGGMTACGPDEGGPPVSCPEGLEEPGRFRPGPNV